MPQNIFPCQEIIDLSSELCRQFRHEYLTPEHTLMVLLNTSCFQEALEKIGVDKKQLNSSLLNHLNRMESIPPNEEYKQYQSFQFQEMTSKLFQHCQESGTAPSYDTLHLIRSILELEESYASTLLFNSIGDKSIDRFLNEYISCVTHSIFLHSIDEDITDSINYDNKKEFTVDGLSSLSTSMLTCMNDHISDKNPLIGRETEMERTIEVLCRKDKNNPLHVGEPGVGKTALVWGLVQKIVSGDVPERLKESKVYLLDIGSLLAGSQYRGEMEKSLKESMTQLENNGKSIVYIDDIHTLIGAGRSGDGALDATDLMKPYMESGRIRFIGSTNYDDYKRYLERNPGILRRFQVIDILEPSVEESINILTQLKGIYENYHNVIYPSESIHFAVESTSKYVNNRFLPDKAIDLIDEAGAHMEIHPSSSRVVSKKLLSAIVSKTSKISSINVDKSTEHMIETLDKRILKRIFGQDEAVRIVVESIQMSKAGLSDDGKPLASLLFVGPTGVGKTEVARVLSEEMGMELIRFDMSEYTEKHTVAKLIGSPSGYVGYDDGGLLTDSIRRNPNCVLLLDEIEKAHSDIYNLLLQVMDYAKLTDNKGKKADFRNVVLIMTSNAGAQYANQASVGFSGGVSRGEAMHTQIKKLFKPEFINRLTSIVTFNDMDRTMAHLILKKKLSELSRKLKSRNVNLQLSRPVFDFLLKEGYSPEYGAREMDRVIGKFLKPILMREILFGKLKNGGKAYIKKTKAQIFVK